MRDSYSGEAPAGVTRRLVWPEEIDTRATRALFIAPVVLSVLVALTRAWGPLFVWLTAEDSVMEWAQFGGFIVAACAAVANGIALLRRRHVSLALLWLAAAAGAFFVAGEEISWGQRVLGIDTPEAFHANELCETTIHNLRGVLFWFNLGMLVVAAYGALVPWWARRRSLPPVTRQLVPPLFLTSWFAVMFVYKSIRMTVVRTSMFTVVEYGEWAETALAVALAAFCVIAFRDGPAAGASPAGIRDRLTSDGVDDAVDGRR